MRIILVTSNSFAAQIAMRQVLTEHESSIQGVLIVTQIRGSHGAQLSRIGEFLRTKSFRFLWFKFIEAVVFPYWVSLAGLWKKGSPDAFRMSLKRYLLKKTIPFRIINDVNSDACKSAIRQWAPDLLVSAYGTQVFGSEIIASVPRAINLHGSLLPKYRGSAPYYWAVANGETTAGVTIHELSDILDGGAILAQTSIPIVDGMSVYAVHYALCRLGGETLSEIISQIKSGKGLMRTPQQVVGERSRLPTRSDMKKFSGRLITLRDFLLLN